MIHADAMLAKKKPKKTKTTAMMPTQREPLLYSSYICDVFPMPMMPPLMMVNNERRVGSGWCMVSGWRSARGL